MTMLSNVGLCVSGRTVERLKKRISDDAVAHAAELMKSGHLFCTTFDNISSEISTTRHKQAFGDACHKLRNFGY